MTKEEFFENYKSKKDFLNDPLPEDVLIDYNVNTIVDEISNRQGTFDEDWEYEWLED